MTIELWILASSIVLGLVQIVASSHAASLQRGYRWAASARDGEAAPLVGVAARLERALRNFGETFPLFASAVIVAHLAGKHGRLTVAGAEMYLGGRIVYVVLYGLGVPPGALAHMERRDDRHRPDSRRASLELKQRETA